MCAGRLLLLSVSLQMASSGRQIISVAATILLWVCKNLVPRNLALHQDLLFWVEFFPKHTGRPWIYEKTIFHLGDAMVFRLFQIFYVKSLDHQ